jgi:PEP-CTERM/exosortase A-associated glycosyltransferase
MRIGIVYGAVSNNLGDLAINHGIAGLLRRLAPDAEVHVVFRNPSETSFGAAKVSFEGIKRFSFSVLSTSDTQIVDFSGDYAELARALEYVLEPARFIADAGLSGCDLVLCNSGEHLFAYEGHDKHVDLVWHILPALAAKAAGMRFVTLPATVGPFEAPAIEGMLRAFFTLNDAIAVRDARSTQFAAKFLNDSSPPVLLDPTFFASVPQASDYNDNRTLGLVMRLENFGLRVGKKRSSVTLANYKERGFGESRAFRFAVATGRSFLDKVGGKINLFIQNPSDSDLTTAIAHALAEQGYGNRLRVVQPASVSEYQEELGRASFIVASRFHACILGLLSGIAVMGVHFDEHGHKMPGLFELLEIPNYCRNLSRTSPESLAASVVPLFLERGHAFAEMAGRLQARQHDTLEWFQAGLRASEARSPVQRDIAGLSLAYITGIEAIRSRAVADMMQTKLGAAREAAKQLKSELESAKQKLTETEQLKNQSKTEAQQLKSELESAKQKLTETEQLKNQSKTEAQQLKSELESAKQKFATKLKATEEKLVSVSSARDRAVQSYRRTREELENILNSISYQLGLEFRKSIRYPGRNTFLLPFRLLHLVRLAFNKQRLSLNKQAKDTESKHDIHNRNKPHAEKTAVIETTEQAVINGISYVFDDQGTEAAERHIGELELSNTKKADLYEHLLDLVFTNKPQQANNLLLKTFELDPTYKRGKRLARLGYKNGMLSQPAAIVARISQMAQWNSQLDASLAEQITGWHEVAVSSLSVPARQSAPLIDKRERTAIMVLNCSRPYHSNGYAIRSHGLLSALSNTSWVVLSYTRPGYPWDAACHIPPDRSECAQIDGIVYRHLKEPKNPNIGTNKYLEAAARAIEAVAVKDRPSLIHAASNHLTGLPALIAARKLGLPFIYEIRGFWEMTTASTNQDWLGSEQFEIQRKLETIIATEADHVVTLTGGLRDELILRGVHEDRVSIIPNCVDTKRFKPLPPNKDLAQKLGLKKAPTIGYVGAFIDPEGLDDLLRAAAMLKEQGVEFNLLLVGDGKVLNKINELVEQLGLRRETFLTGRIPHEEVEQYYSLIDIAPFPRKPFPVCEIVSPLKPLEAMAMGKVVLASSVGGLKEIVEDGKTGLVFEKGNIESLAETLLRVIRDKSLSERIRIEGMRWVNEKRTWETAAKELMNIYDQLC